MQPNWNKFITIYGLEAHRMCGRNTYRKWCKCHKLVLSGRFRAIQVAAILSLPISNNEDDIEIILSLSKKLNVKIPECLNSPQHRRKAYNAILLKAVLDFPEIKLAIQKPTKKDIQKSARKRVINPEAVAQDKIDRFYASYEWRRLRYSTLKELGFRCLACGRSVKEGAVIHVDHIKPLRKNWELRLDPNNLQPLCDLCNHGKGNWDESDLRG